MKNNELLLNLPGCQVLAIQQDAQKFKKRYLSALTLIWGIGLLICLIVYFETYKINHSSTWATPAYLRLHISHIRMALLLFCIAASVLLGVMCKDYARTPKTQYILHFAEDAPESTFMEVRKEFDLERICAGLWTATPRKSGNAET